MLLALVLWTAQERVRFLEYPPDRPVAAAVGRVKVLHRYPGHPLVFGAGPPRPFVRGGVARPAPPAVEKALDWMSEQQAPDGSFAQDEEITGLCLLAFLAAGHSPRDAAPRIRLVLRRGFARLLSNVRPHPSAASPPPAGIPSFAHSAIQLAKSEAHPAGGPPPHLSLAAGCWLLAAGCSN